MYVELDVAIVVHNISVQGEIRETTLKLDSILVIDLIWWSEKISIRIAKLFSGMRVLR